MAWSKTTRISIMLAIDIAFFLVELISGFLVHSLALMADAFHMLNDIISLIIGLWAVTVATRATTNRFSYGWLRAEILGAFFNAVFLIALCISIILEAVTRFVEPQEVSNPKLILIVGCCGLASNLVGFVVLGGHGHDHGHGHGHDEHDHEHVHQHDDVAAAEEGRADPTSAFTDENGPIGDVLPEVAVARAQAGGYGSNAGGNSGNNRINWERRRASSLKRNRFTNIDELNIHPASFRQDIIDRSTGDETDDSSVEDNATVETAIRDESVADENSPLIPKGIGNNNGTISKDKPARQSTSRSRRDSGVHDDHHHTKPKSKSKKGHSHGHNHADMGMNAMVLHVLGDALGNVGVIATALIIWLTNWPGRYYADPAVSLFITLIILRSAIPLTKATSKVLLQATPDHLDLQDVKDDIQRLPGVISCHHVHIWQLSDTKVVASLHVQIAFPITDEGGAKYMKLAKQARKCLHAYGIHSATIQPEFCLDQNCNHLEDGSVSTGGQQSPLQHPTKLEPGDGCLLNCVDDCVDQGCCAIPSQAASKAGSSRRSSHSTTHNHDHGHDHTSHQHS
ncbi:cation efflux protein [Xylaria cubensis]|nr:cation efflux protein [Xylaria cubensis]